MNIFFKKVLLLETARGISPAAKRVLTGGGGELPHFWLVVTQSYPGQGTPILTRVPPPHKGPGTKERGIPSSPRKDLGPDTGVLLSPQKVPRASDWSTPFPDGQTNRLKI